MPIYVLFVAGEWDEETENWLRWARTPGFDAYWYYRDAFLDWIVPLPSGSRRTLEIGCVAKVASLEPGDSRQAGRSCTGRVPQGRSFGRLIRLFDLEAPHGTTPSRDFRDVVKSIILHPAIWASPQWATGRL